VNDYAHAYRLLGVPPHCSLSELKAARRRLAKSWHPDHFPVGTEKRRQAEERIKDINTAFEHLLRYHRRFGVLPVPSANVTARTTSTAVDPAPRSVATPQDTSSEGEPSLSSFPTPYARNTWAATRWIALLSAASLVVATAYIALRHTDQLPTPPNLAPRPRAADARGKSASHEPSAARPAHDRYFTIGSTLGQVYAAQGVPTSTKNDAWFYGKSIVYFTDGIVTSWEEDPANPLNATMLAISTPSTPRTFALGSTKEEVRAAEGAPLFESPDLWDYGLSKVYFRDDRVVSWESSPLRPLKTRR
jgi:DnaJ domain